MLLGKKSINGMYHLINSVYISNFFLKNAFFTPDSTLRQELEDDGIELIQTERNFIPLVKPCHFLLFATGATNIPTIGV